MECCAGGGKDIKNRFFLTRASLNNPLIMWCFSVQDCASDRHEMQSGLCQSRLSDRKEAARMAEVQEVLMNGWLVTSLWDNNLWRQVGAMYFL